MRYLESTIFNYLTKAKLGVSKQYITSVIVSHPEFPALTAAIDTLTTLGVQYNAVIADKTNVQELTFPLLIHTTSNGGELLYIHNQAALTPTIIEQWDGVTVMLTCKNFTNNKENIAAYAVEQKQKKQFNILLISIVGLLLFPFICHISNYSIIPLLIIILSIAGVGLGVLIYLQEQGIDNSITDTLCKKTEDCNAVTNSKAATLFWGIKWSDIGIVYFTTITLLLSITAYTIGLLQMIDVLIVISVLSLPFAAYSIYYQWHKAKKWCVLCLYTVAILWIQFIVLAVHFFINKNSFTNLAALVKIGIIVLFALVIIGAIWLLLIKPLLHNKQKTTAHINNLLRFKNNPTSFTNALVNQSPITIPVQPNDLQLGNPNAAVQLVVACNPYCGPCVDAHFKLEEMLHYTKEHIGLTIHFMVNHTPNNSKRTNAINAIYNALDANKAIGNATKTEEILHQWFTINDVDKFNQFYNLPDSSTTISNLQKSDTSTWDNKIEFTPTLLINGYILPKQYTISDFIKMVLPFINDEDLVNKLKKEAN